MGLPSTTAGLRRSIRGKKPKRRRNLASAGQEPSMEAATEAMALQIGGEASSTIVTH